MVFLGGAIDFHSGPRGRMRPKQLLLDKPRFHRPDKSYAMAAKSPLATETSITDVGNIQ